MKTYTFRIREQDRDIFQQIKDGQKKVETRVAGPRYKNITAGDGIILICGKSKLSKKVKKATLFKSISAMLKKYKVKDIMPNIANQKEMEEIYYSFSGYRAKIKKHGLIAIELI